MKTGPKIRYNKYSIQDEYCIMYIEYKSKILEVLIDKEDIDLVISKGRWQAYIDKSYSKETYYIQHYYYDNKLKKNKAIKLHRLITNCPNGFVVDHINHNTLDNRKCNLRVLTDLENKQNMKNKGKLNLTGIRKMGNKYSSRIQVNGISYCKHFDTIEEAIEFRKLYLPDYNVDIVYNSYL